MVGLFKLGDIEVTGPADIHQCQSTPDHNSDRASTDLQVETCPLSGMPIAGILGSPVSGLILDRVHWFGLGSWRWLLILEGIPALACGLLTYFLLPSRPAEAKFLTADEKEWIRTELACEEHQKLKQRQFSTFQALTSGRVWHLVAIYFGMLTGLYSLNFWAP